MRIPRPGPVLCGLAILSLSAQACRAAEDQLSLTNATGYRIVSVYVRPTDGLWWRVDLPDVLDSGRFALIRLPRAWRDSCRYDLLVTYAEGGAPNWTGFDLCRAHRVTLSYDAAAHATRAAIE